MHFGKAFHLIDRSPNQISKIASKKRTINIIPIKNSNSFSKLENVLYQAIQYIEENTNKKITVSDVVNHISYNRSHLSRKFSKELGGNLSDFIKQRKLAEGKDLLAFSDKSISEISAYLCFSNQSHFEKAFKDQFNVTPHAFIKSVLI